MTSSSEPTGAHPDHERYAFDDAAYVLGGLDLAGRAAFETHLSDCAACQRNVAELGAVPALLQRADVSAWVPEVPPETLLPRLLREVRLRRRRHLLRTVVGAAVAACLLVVLTVVGLRAWSDAGQPSATRFVPVSAEGAHVSATVTVSDGRPGTRLRVKCGDYTGPSGGYYGDGTSAGDYQLVVINRAGLRQDLVSWKPGPEVDLSTATNWPKGAISRVVIEDANQVPVLQVVF